MKFEKIYIELSDICGLNCSFCPSQKGVRGMMSVKDFEHLASKLTKKARIYTFHLLGDPLILPNLKTYIEKAAFYNMALELTTNGFYLDEKKQNLLLTSKNIRQINISLASFFEQKKLDFQSYIKPILKLLNTHIQNKNTNFINLRLWNLDQNFCSPEQNKEIYEFLEQNFELKLDLNTQKNRLSSKIFLHLDKRFEWASLENKNSHTQGSCHALTKQLGVLSNGKLVPCCMDTKAELSLGSLFECSLDELLNTQRAIKMKEGFKKGILVEKLCQKCEFHKIKVKS